MLKGTLLRTYSKDNQKRNEIITIDSIQMEHQDLLNFGEQLFKKVFKAVEAETKVNQVDFKELVTTFAPIIDRLKDFPAGKRWLESKQRTVRSLQSRNYLFWNTIIIQKNSFEMDQAKKRTFFDSWMYTTGTFIAEHRNYIPAEPLEYDHHRTLIIADAEMEAHTIQQSHAHSLNHEYGFFLDDYGSLVVHSSLTDSKVINIPSYSSVRIAPFCFHTMKNSSDTTTRHVYLKFPGPSDRVRDFPANPSVDFDVIHHEPNVSFTIRNEGNHKEWAEVIVISHWNTSLKLHCNFEPYFQSGMVVITNGAVLGLVSNNSKNSTAPKIHFLAGGDHKSQNSGMYFGKDDICGLEPYQSGGISGYCVKYFKIA